MRDRYRRVLYPFLSARGRLWFDPALAWSADEIEAIRRWTEEDHRRGIRPGQQVEVLRVPVRLEPASEGWNSESASVISSLDVAGPTVTPIHPRRSEREAVPIRSGIHRGRAEDEFDEAADDLEQEERRRTFRRRFTRPIMVVPSDRIACLDCLTASLPDPVMARDISGSGLAWVSTRRPEAGKLIVGLGAIEGRPVRLEAVPVRIVAYGRGCYRVGARWLRRLPE
jgi:hypothetical protein